MKLRSVYTKSSTELGRFIDQVHNRTKTAQEHLNSPVDNTGCSTLFAHHRSTIEGRALQEESKCAAKTRTNILSTVNSFFYSFHDEAVRQSTQSQWLAIATLGRYNVVTQMPDIVEELEEIIAFSDFMWNESMANVRNEVRLVENELDKEDELMERCCSEALGSFGKALEWNVLQAMRC